MTSFLSSLLFGISDSNLIALLSELQTVTGVRIEIFTERCTLNHYLEQCVRPNGASTKQLFIKRKDLELVDPFNELLLRRQIKSFGDNSIFNLCDEIVRVRGAGESIEHVDGRRLYSLINYYYKVSKTKKKKESVNIWKFNNINLRKLNNRV